MSLEAPDYQVLEDIHGGKHVAVRFFGELGRGGRQRSTILREHMANVAVGRAKGVRGRHLIALGCLVIGSRLILDWRSPVGSIAGPESFGGSSTVDIGSCVERTLRGHAVAARLVRILQEPGSFGEGIA